LKVFRPRGDRDVRALTRSMNSFPDDGGIPAAAGVALAASAAD